MGDSEPLEFAEEFSEEPDACPWLSEDGVFCS